MADITQEQWQERREKMLSMGVGLAIYNPVTDQTITMELTAEEFRKLPGQLQWEAYLLPAMVQLGLADPDA